MNQTIVERTQGFICCLLRSSRE